MDRDRRDRAYRLEGWHDVLVDRLVGTDTAGLLDRLVSHPALGGPELTFLRARLAERRGDTLQASRLVSDALEDALDRIA